MTDELTPVRCGCGGEAEVHIMGHELTKAQYYINCEKCDTRTWFFDTEAEGQEVRIERRGFRFEPVAGMEKEKDDL